MTREQKRAYDQRYYKRNRLRMLKATKIKHDIQRRLIDAAKANPCVDCGGCFPPCAMDFDHIDGVKKWNVGNMASHSVELLLREIAKCELVCANCHRVRTNRRRLRKCS